MWSEWRKATIERGYNGLEGERVPASAAFPPKGGTTSRKLPAIYRTRLPCLHHCFRFALQDRQLQPLVPRKRVCLPGLIDLLHRLIQPAPGFVALTEALVGHGQEQPVKSRSSLFACSDGLV